MACHLHIDPFSGIAGDMFIGALLDLGLPFEDFRAAMAKLPIAQPYRLTAERVLRRSIAGIDFKVITEGLGPGDTQNAGFVRIQKQNGSGNPLAPTQANTHEHTGYRDIVAMIDHLDLSKRGKDRARRIVSTLARAEAEIHSMDIEQVHFHEVGAVDSIIDMLGAAVGVEMLAIDTVTCGPLPLNRGFVRCQHGKMPVPAPATALIMRGMAVVGVDRNVELVTPTGAAIIAGLESTFVPAPPMTLKAVGHGAGDRDDPEVPNLLRLLLGTPTARQQPVSVGGVDPLLSRA